MDHPLAWPIFLSVIAVLLYVDLGILNRHSHKVSIKEAGFWVALWVSCALIFNLGIYFKLGHVKALEFFTGYLIEYSLSIDNLFVFVLIFSYFGTESKHQPRILRWGILGAIFDRFVIIFVGVTLVKTFHWIVYVFGAFLVYSAIRMLLHKDEKIEPEKNLVLRGLKKILPFIDNHDGEEFFVKHDSKWYATQMFAILVIVNMSDIVFAVDSIPAILAITHDQFIVYSSNIFAILGLRATYFLLSGALQVFRYLKYAITLILCFVGVKMLVSGLFHISTLVSLATIMSILSVAIIASILHKQKTTGSD
jgi:TerC family integral membrane protein